MLLATVAAAILSLILSLPVVAASPAPAGAKNRRLHSVAPLNVVLVSDSVAQAEQIRRAAAGDTIAIVYHSESMTTAGLISLLGSVSVANNGAHIGHLGIVAHGCPGTIHLGSGNDLSLTTLPSQAAALGRLRSVFTDNARLDLYACSVAAGTGGKTFVDELSAAMDAAVFASDNPVGTVAGADFIWEYHAGRAAATSELFSIREMETIRQLHLAGSFSNGDHVEAKLRSGAKVRAITEGVVGTTPLYTEPRGSKGTVSGAPQQAYYQGVLYWWYPVDWDDGNSMGWTADVALGLAFGRDDDALPVGSFNGVTAYSNGYPVPNFISNVYNYQTGINTGMEWQCVEYVNRYYYNVYGMNIRIEGQNANEYYGNAAQMGLVSYKNGGTTAPQVGDILCFAGNSDGSGHVAIIRAVTDSWVTVIQQNWTEDDEDAHYPFAVTVSNGAYSVSRSGNLSVQGWLRTPEPAPPSYRLLHTFTGVGDDGSRPYGSLTLSGSTLYGMTYAGGIKYLGTVFKINTDGTNVGTLYSFTGGAGDGEYPYGDLTLSGSTLYGMTNLGGLLQAWSSGTVFQISTTGAGYAIRHTFSFFSFDGLWPEGSPTLSGSMLYGMTPRGGTHDRGTVFRMSTDGTGDNGDTILHSFAGGSGNGTRPYGSLTLSGSMLYGMTAYGGSSDRGTVFKIDNNGHVSLRDFAGGIDDGRNPNGNLTLSGSTLYGMTHQGGEYDAGVVFRINTDGSGFTILHDFAGGTGDGAFPHGSLTLSGSTLYGMTPDGGAAGDGVIFQINADGSDYTVLHHFGVADGDGAAPYGSLTLSDSTLYGLTSAGGSSNRGVVFALTPPVGQSATTLTAVANPPGAGSVAGGGSYAVGADVEVSASAKSGWTFTGWSGDLTGTANPATIQMNGNRNVTANFQLQGTNWLQIDRFRMGLPLATGHDSFALRGSCNTWLDAGTLPKAVTLRIGNWSVAIPASAWKEVGTFNVYTCAQDGILGKMTYSVNGTTKCLFQFSASKQTIQGNLPDFPDVPVRLQVGDGFDETLTIRMTVTNHLAGMSSIGSLPLFCVQKLTMARNLKQPNSDALSLSAKLLLSEPFNPALDGITMNIGPCSIPVPAGTLQVVRSGVLRYSTPTAKGRLTVVFNVKAGALNVLANGIDLSTLTPDTHVSLAIDNHSGADWNFALFMAVNKAGTVYRY